MSSRREVLIRILALLQRKTLIETKKCLKCIKMLKTALFDCAINEKCCSVDGGRGICRLFLSPPRWIWQLKNPHPWEFAIQGKKSANAQVQPRARRELGAGGIGWCIRSKPNWASNTFTILSCSIFFSLIRYCFLCCFFLFIRASFKPASLNWAPLTKDCSI